MPSRESVIAAVTRHVANDFSGDWRKAFDHYDWDDDGSLSLGELTVLFRVTVGRLWASMVARSVLAELDTDGSGGVSWEEFQSAFQAQTLVMRGTIVSLFNLQTRIRTRLALRLQGKGFWEIQEAMANWSDDLIPIAANMAKVKVPEALMAVEATGDGVGALGDGTILQAIWDFLNSPEGKALIQALLMLLMMFI